MSSHTGFPRCATRTPSSCWSMAIVIERGTHDELLAKKGEYYQLYHGMFELA